MARAIQARAREIDAILFDRVYQTDKSRNARHGAERERKMLRLALLEQIEAGATL
jgi:hypothetical protein